MLAFVTGMLASLGYFNLALLFGVMVLADISTDIFYYSLGRGGTVLRIVKKLEKRFGITQEKLEYFRSLWQGRAFRTMLVSKLAWGIAPIMLATAGYVKMPLKRFLRFSVPLSFLQYGFLLMLGYYFGSAYALVENALVRGQLLITAALLFAVAYYAIAGIVRKKFLAKQEKSL